MLDSLILVLSSLWHQDFATLQTPGSAGMIYLCILSLIWLESAFIPAAPLPCDSIVILSGTLAAVGILSLPMTLGLIIFAAATGSFISLLQGRWLHKLPKVRGWIDAVPPKQLQTVDNLLTRHGLVALFIARFIPIVRPLLPLMMGLREQKIHNFHYLSWLSATLWASVLVGFGYSLSFLPEKIARVVTIGLMVAPFLTLGVAILTYVSSHYFKRSKS